MRWLKKSYGFGRLFLPFVLIFNFCMVAGEAYAKRPKYLFKMASLAPEGSIWAQRFDQFALEV